MTKIIWILNLNHDSFVDWWKYCSVDKAYKRAKEMIWEWAHIIELWWFSTKPWSTMPTVDEELKRILPTLKKINTLDIPLSIETCRSEIVKEVVLYKNVKYINDTSWLSDTQIIDIIQPLGIHYILLHMPTTYEKSNTINPEYEKDITSELLSFFKNKIDILEKKNMTKVIIDPWFFYHKWVMENLDIIKNLKQLHIFSFPLFIGLSRKSVILPPSLWKTNCALIESSILTFECLKSGVDYIRVHDIKEIHHVLQLYNIYKKYLI